MFEASCDLLHFFPAGDGFVRLLWTLAENQPANFARSTDQVLAPCFMNGASTEHTHTMCTVFLAKAT